MLLVVLLMVDIHDLFSAGLIYIFLLAILNLGGMYTFYRAVSAKGVALTLPIIYSWVFVTAILGMLFYGEAITPLQWLALVTIIAGVFIISSKRFGSIAFDKTFVFAFLAMLFWGVFYFLLKIPNVIFGALLVTGTVNLLTSFVSLPIIITRKINVFKIRGRIFLAIALIGILDTLGFLAFNYSITSTPVAIVSAVSATAPVFVVLMGVFFLKERINRKQVLGISVTVFGLLLIAI